MVRAIERGLSLWDFKELTVGMIIGYIATYNGCNSSEEQGQREATQEDFDAF